MSDLLPRMPHLFFMFFAPLDVWGRLLLAAPNGIGPRYWLRLVSYLLTSAVGTFITLPERLAFWLFTRCVAVNPQCLPSPLFVLGYYRSGTTHLHYLLSCDRRLYPPRRYQVLLPQGFVLSWAVLRFGMVGFMPTKRPMDHVRIGLEFPDEDQVGVLNWSLASSLPGRTVLPQAIAHFLRFQTADPLTPEELDRWKDCQSTLARKLQLLARGRRLVLKSPPHTAMIPQLLDVFGNSSPPKFIHISRHPKEVLESNLRMHRQFYDLWALQDPIDDEILKDYLVTDYLETEQRYIEARKNLPPGTVAEIRYEDLRADPVGELRRVYQELELEFDSELEARLVRYLEDIRDYQPITRQVAHLPDRLSTLELATLIDEFGHDRPAKCAVAQSGAAVCRKLEHLHAAGMSLATAAVCGLVWMVLAGYTGAHYPHLNRLVWLTGLLVGYCAWRCAGNGSRALGAWCAGVTLLVLVTVNTILPASMLRGDGIALWPGLAPIMRQTLTTIPTLFWTPIALLSAYRLGAQPRLPWR